MVKIISARWAEKDDPMFTGRFTISSRKQRQKKENSNSLRTAIRKEENPKNSGEVNAETPAAHSQKKED